MTTLKLCVSDLVVTISSRRHNSSNPCRSYHQTVQETVLHSGQTSLEKESSKNSLSKRKSAPTSTNLISGPPSPSSAISTTFVTTGTTTNLSLDSASYPRRLAVDHLVPKAEIATDGSQGFFHLFSLSLKAPLARNNVSLRHVRLRDRSK